MTNDRHHKRILIYSHDTFGLGHLRRCRTIAHSLVERYKELSVLILSGSPIIGSFDFRARVDFVRIPGVIKLRNGEYTSLNLHIDIDETLAMRASIIQHTAAIFEPDLFIVDKEPLGLRGEVLPTLKLLQAPRHARSCSACATSWTSRACSSPSGSARRCCRRCESSTTRSGSTACRRSAIRSKASRCRRSVRQKMVYTGYLHRDGADHRRRPTPAPRSSQRALPAGHHRAAAATARRWSTGCCAPTSTIRCCPYPALLVLGPFMQPERQAEFIDRAARLKRVDGDHLPRASSRR